MKSSDLNRIIKVANQIAEENASVYEKQITKSYVEKEIFRPDSFIKISASGAGIGTSGTTNLSSGAGAQISSGPTKVSIPKLEWTTVPNLSSDITYIFYLNVLSAISGFSAQGRDGGKLVAINLAYLAPAQTAGIGTSGMAVTGITPTNITNPTQPQMVPKKLEATTKDYAYFWNKYQGSLSSKKWQIDIGQYRDIERTLFQLGIPQFEVDLQLLPNIKIEMCEQLNSLAKQIQEKLNYVPQPETTQQKIKKFTETGSSWWSTLLNQMIENQRG
jgi:hypothetical protein